MKILLDENLPRKLIAALQNEGHETESVQTLKLQGLENGKLYEFARDRFDLCFTRDFGFAHNMRHDSGARVRLLRVTIPQKRQNELVAEFVAAFRASDWRRYQTGDDWP